MKLNLSALMSVAACSAMAIGLTACIDDNYDLSDIDSTVQMTVKDLTVPVNLGAVTLRDVLDLKEDDDIKEMNGEYVVFKDGSFSSDPIKIDKVEIRSNAITPAVVNINYSGLATDLPEGLVIPVGSQTFSYTLQEPSLSTFEFNDNNIDSRIKGIEYMSVNWNITFNFNISDSKNNFKQFSFRNIHLQVPEGFVFADEVKDMVVGPTELAVPEVVFSEGVSSYSITIPVVGVNFKRMIETGVASFTPGKTKDAPGTFTINSELGIHSGEVLAVTNETITTGSTLELRTSPVMTNILINDFTGQIAYDIKDLNVNDIDLSSLPDFLSGDETNLVLSNPQLYLSVTNPAGQFGGEPSTGLQLIPVRYNAQGKEVLGAAATPEKDIVIPSNQGVGPYKFCLAPQRPEKFYEGFAGAEMIGYKALGTVLSGEGIPSKLRVNFVNPCIDGTVTNFTLGTSLPKVEGNYTMYCPLSLGQGSKIVYASDETGWGEDVQKITIKQLNVTAVCNNDLPFDVTFKNCYPLDAKGNRISNVTINEVTVRSGQNQEINIEVTGEFTNFDGIHFEAVATQTSDQTLRPGTELTLKNIRARVSGYYTDKL